VISKRLGQEKARIQSFISSWVFLNANKLSLETSREGRDHGFMVAPGHTELELASKVNLLTLATQIDTVTIQQQASIAPVHDSPMARIRIWVHAVP
jgi:hypothetical protein